MKCIKCNIEQSEDEFYKGKTHNGNRCKTCRREETRLYRKNNPIRMNMLKARERAKKKNRTFTVGIRFLEKLWQDQGGRCALSGIPFAPYGEKVNFPFTPSLDRIDSKKGYIEGNVRFILFGLNTALSNYGLEVYLEIAKAVIKEQEG